MHEFQISFSVSLTCNLFLCFGVSTPFHSLATQKLNVKGATFAPGQNKPLVSYKLENIAVRAQLLLGPGCSKSYRL